MAALSRSIRSALVRFKLKVVLNQLFMKALSARYSIASSKGTLVNKEETSYDARTSPLLTDGVAMAMLRMGDTCE